MEEEAMQHIKTLVSQEVGAELYQLWREYEEGKTPEAKIVKDLDKFDMIFQAYEYEKAEKTPGRLEEFFTSTKGKFSHPEVLKWVGQLEELRKQDKTPSTS
jgi:putative hydrolase of HD superfamily